MNAPKTLAVMNLLAVIHQDGGQHVHAVGLEQACKEGEAIFLKLRQEVEAMHATKQHEPELPIGEVFQKYHDEYKKSLMPPERHPVSEMTLDEKIAAAKEKLAAEAANIRPADLQS